ncbi:serine/threonine-protein kinase [Chondromyces apiculatus]|uniref:Putative serine/threonine protein kinase n=1 Tax=Chondromyces apiculatus DSM 436 TaxID=1192034 RepID=A0A017SZK6_9BACT|nr:serine/threonine-protein kinase [Chondromyces apiculatus]EYF02419.1 putative serine/threonine protein kinase [Chondromyces apiculatus DSM 436]
MPQVKFLDPSDARRRLDRYELIGEIASGGMASVFLARLGGAGGFQRFVAIKRLHPHLASEAEFIEMFLDEARLAAGIHHPHVVPILEVGTTEAGYYLVMEYIEGDTMARVLARAASGGKMVPRSVVVRILLDALAGLHAAHELTGADGKPVQLVHRDCSPQNILVGVDGCTRLTDFGVARAMSRLSSTRPDRMKGKLAYMSPEQTRGGQMDRRSDLFAMGAVLWESLAGRRLFKADSEGATLSRIMNDPIPKLRDAAPSAPAMLEAVCARALERDLAKRYQSAAEMAEALEAAALEGLPEGVASPKQVAATMRELLGQEIAAQRESVRVWLQHESSNAGAEARPWGDLVDPGRGVPSIPAAASSVSSAVSKIIPVALPDDPAPEAAPRQHPSLTPGSMTMASRVPTVTVNVRRSRGRGWMAGVAAAVLLVGGGLTAWSALRRSSASTQAVASGPPVAASAAMPVAPAAPAVAPAALRNEAPGVAAAPENAAQPAAEAAAVNAAPPASASAEVLGPSGASAPTALAPVPSSEAPRGGASPQGGSRWTPPRPKAATPEPKAATPAPASDMANPYR